MRIRARPEKSDGHAHIFEYPPITSVGLHLVGIWLSLLQFALIWSCFYKLKNQSIFGSEHNKKQITNFAHKVSAFKFSRSIENVLNV